MNFGAIAAFFIGAVLVVNLCRLPGCLKEGHAPAPVRHARASSSSPRHVRHAAIPASYRPTAASQETTARPVFQGDSVDLVAHPERIYDELVRISRKNGVHEEIPGSMWQLETGEVYGDRGGAGGAGGKEVLAMDQYRVRDHWLGRKEVSVLDAPQGGECAYLRAKLSAAGLTTFEKIKSGVGNGTRNAWALCEIADRHGFKAETLWASRGRATMTHQERNFGGCIGPIQITPIEWIDHGEIDLNPLVFQDAFDGMTRRIARQQQRFIKEGHDPARAMQMAISGYAGRDKDQKYYAKVLVKVREWRKMEAEGTLRAFLTKKAHRAGAKWRKASNLYASN